MVGILCYAGLDLASLQDWFIPGIVVRILETVGDRGLANQTGIIRGIKVSSNRSFHFYFFQKSGYLLFLFQDGTCTVFIEDEGQDFHLLCDHLEPVTPVINDQVKVLIGDEKGMVGILLNIDEQEGVVEFENEKNPKMVPLRFLCRYQPN